MDIKLHLNRLDDGWLSEDSLEDHDSEDEHNNTDNIVWVLQDEIDDNDADDGRMKVLILIFLF